MPRSPDANLSNIVLFRPRVSNPTREIQSAEPKRIIMIRHMKAVHNKRNLLAGQLDTSLTVEGLEQAERAARQLKREPIVLIVTSDTQRGRESAEIVKGSRRHLRVQTTSLARERHYGVLEERKMTPEEFLGSEFADNLKTLLQQKPVSEHAHIELVPGWETDARLAQRMEMVIKLIEQFLLPGQTALFVSHAHAMRAWLELRGNLELDGSGSIPHGSGVMISALGDRRNIVKLFGGIKLHRETEEDEDSFIRITRKYIKKSA